jgi:hypothetical protein
MARNDPEFTSHSVHLRWNIDTKWNYPTQGFYLYRRPYEQYRNLQRNELALGRYRRLRYFLFRILIVLYTTLAFLGFRGARKKLDELKNRFSVLFYTLQFDEPVREVELVFRGNKRTINITGWDQDRLTILGEFTAGEGKAVRLMPVVDRLHLSVSISSLSSVTFTPIAPDILQWPEGTLDNWGQPIAHFHLPNPGMVSEALDLLHNHGIDTGMTDDEFREAYIELLRDLHERNAYADLLTVSTDVLERFFRGRRWNVSEGEGVRMRPLELIAMLTVHPALAKFFGFYYQDNLEGRKDYERFDYLIVADWGNGLVASAADYGLSADTEWPLISPHITNISVTDRTFPAPFGTDERVRGQRVQVELHLGFDSKSIDRWRAPFFEVYRNNNHLGDGMPTPYSPGTRIYWDTVSELGTFYYKVVGQDIFGRQAPVSEEKSVTISAEHFPLPAAPVQVTAFWQPPSGDEPGNYHVSWLWTQELRDLFPRVDRFKVMVRTPESDQGDHFLLEVPLENLIPMQITTPGTQYLEGNLVQAPVPCPVGEGSGTFDPIQQTAMELRQRIASIIGQEGKIGVQVTTDLELSESALGIFNAPNSNVKFEIKHGNTWQEFKILEHTAGSNVVFIIVSDPDYDWGIYTGNEPFRLKFDSEGFATLCKKTGASVAGITKGVLGDATGRSYIILAADKNGTLLILNRTGNDSLQSAPQVGNATLALPQSVRIEETGVLGPTLAESVKQLGFRVVAVEQGSREGAASDPAVVTRVFEQPPPAIDRPAASLISLPDLEQKCRVRVSWNPAGDGYAYEILRISERRIQMFLSKYPVAGIDPSSVPAMSDAELVALISPSTDTGEHIFEREFDLVGNVKADITQFEDVLDSAGIRFFYAVRVLDSAGNRGPISAASDPVLPPDLRAPMPPEGIRTYWDNGKVWISWSVPSRETVDSFRLFRSADQKPISPYLIRQIARNVIPEAEPLYVRDGRVRLPEFDVDNMTLEAVIGVAEDGSADASVDFSPFVIISSSGTDLQSLWSEGLPVLIEATQADGTKRVFGDGDQPITVQYGSVTLDVLPDDATLEGIYPRHLAQLSGDTLMNRPDLPDLMEHGYIDEVTNSFRSFESEGTRWVIELEAIADSSQKQILEFLEEANANPIEYRNGVIRLPYFNANERRLAGLYLWQDTQEIEDSTSRQLKAGAINHLDRYDLDMARRLLIPRWRDGVQVTVRYALGNGQSREFQFDPLRLRLPDDTPPDDLEEWFYSLQAGRTVHGTPVWSQLSITVPQRKRKFLEPPVWILAEWEQIDESIYHRLAWRGPTPGIYKLSRRAADEQHWSDIVEIKWESDGINNSIFERVPGNETWEASTVWSQNNGLIQGETAEVDPTIFYDYRVTRRFVEDSPDEIPSLLVRIKPLFGPEIEEEETEEP